MTQHEILARLRDLTRLPDAECATRLARLVAELDQEITCNTNAAEAAWHGRRCCPRTPEASGEIR